mmetsp:Transcript_14642/g.40415  ORF Transcript_14642/g.40415 Transcript_14642/m.40415 type:complete len:216 (-) Transcript_14642:1251-1898(-)|eukprot:CAMPEP_0198113032 /NCGR_PEP_ID=MMETSP1442-20131203/4792_1 /TAXON_ID= /ORGANISM="Craspedostauros australis, Strain CCMP3328" /LENGTH=215 /DNA_ID=CAMNT_0043770009 /DNA_START=267 /DNA_END=914 /DNA_ORIENTATION=+
MTGSEIINIAMTVGVVQAICDIIATYSVYNGDSYKTVVSRMERARWTLHRAEADLKKNATKHAKRHERAKRDFEELCSLVAQRHMIPNIFISIFFLMLLRILGAEHKGNVMAIVPFVPFDLLSKITTRGLDWKSIPRNVLAGTSDSNVVPKQAASFLFVYALSTISVKYYVNKLVATKAPKGAEGLEPVMNSPRVKSGLKSMGLDPDEFMDDKQT